MNIGQRIKQKRESLGLSQEELAQRLGYKSRSTINKIESGINDITQSKVVEFARALQTTPSALMGWEDEKKEENKTEGKDPEEIIILNRAAKKMTPENQKKLLEMAKIMFKDDFDE